MYWSFRGQPRSGASSVVRGRVLLLAAFCRLPSACLAAAALLLALTPHALAFAQSNPEKLEGIPIYGSPDESAPPVATLSPGESVAPVAESQGGGVKWYLIRTKGGVVGWIKQSDHAQSKTLDSFFKSLPPEPSASAQIPLASSAAAPRGSIIVPVLLAGRSAIVPVTFNQSVRGNLLLDTGASNTVLSRRLADLLSLRPIASRNFQTPGGRVSASIAPLQSLKVGDAEVNNLTVAILDFSSDPRFEGLLGMDFLGRYAVALDAQRQVLVLVPR
jgi:hypothetical protein